MKTFKFKKGDNKGAILAVCFVFRWFEVFCRANLRRGMPKGQVSMGMQGLSSPRHSKRFRVLIFALSEKERVPIEGQVVVFSYHVFLKKTHGKGGNFSPLLGVLVVNGVCAWLH